MDLLQLLRKSKWNDGFEKALNQVYLFAEFEKCTMTLQGP